MNKYAIVKQKFFKVFLCFLHTLKHSHSTYIFYMCLQHRPHADSPILPRLIIYSPNVHKRSALCIFIPPCRRHAGFRLCPGREKFPKTRKNSRKMSYCKKRNNIVQYKRKQCTATKTYFYFKEMVEYETEIC